MKQEFIDAVAENNLDIIRISLTNELLLDPRGSTFSEMLSYALENVPDLFEENKEANYTVPQKKEWDEDFLFRVKNDLDFNFSKEKLVFYEEVVKTVGKIKAEHIDNDDKADKKHYLSKKTSAIITAGGATLAVIGVAAGKTVLTVVGGAALVVGGVLLLTNKKR